MIITSKLDDIQILQRIHAAAIAYSNLVGNDYLIIGKNKKTDYYWFECTFKEENLMHLLGLTCKTMTASEFYKKCLNENSDGSPVITLNVCTPSRNHGRHSYW